MVYHLKRRKEEGQILGCPVTPSKIEVVSIQMDCLVERPCLITRDMCVRMNNIHLLTPSFTSLTSYLHSSMHVSSLKPITAFGYVSGEKGSPLPHKGEGSSHRDTGSSMRDTGSSWVNSTDPDGLVPRPHTNGEAGFGSAESDQFLEYLRNIQNFQVQILCVRMNQFTIHTIIYTQTSLLNVPFTSLTRYDPVRTYASHSSLLLLRQTPFL